MSLRAYRLRGRAAAQALDWLHVHADVRGAVEADAPAAARADAEADACAEADARAEAEVEITVWLAGPLPPLPFALQVDELPAAIANQQASGREGDRAILVADDLLVRPPWVPLPPQFRGLDLVVPRGAAFGSGEHGSTQATLLCLHACWPGRCRSFADVGTGSGILALYAARRGAGRLLACDVDAAAVAAARELLPAAEVVLGGPEALPAAADLVVANLAAAELLAALPAIRGRWTGQAPLVLGGIRRGEADAVLAAVRLSPCHRHEVGGFTAFAFPSRV